MSLIRIQHIRAAKGLGVCLAWMALALAALAQSMSTTTVQGTVYLANGSPGSGTLQISWPAFTTASNQTVAAGKITTDIGADGFVSVNLAPNLGSSPAGLYYTAVYHMSDGTTSTEYWVVPTAAQASIAQVRSQVMPAAQAVQAVSKAYVDQAIQSIAQGILTSTGGQLTGPLYLAGDPTQALQAADKHYVDASFALALPVAGGTMTGPLAVTGAISACATVPCTEFDDYDGAQSGSSGYSSTNLLSHQFATQTSGSAYQGFASLHIHADSLQGGTNFWNGTGTKTDYATLLLTHASRTVGQREGLSNGLNCFASGDCMGIATGVTQWGGYDTGGDEQTFGGYFDINQGTTQFTGSVASIAGNVISYTGATNDNTLGEHRLLIDTATAYTTGTISNISSLTITGSGTAWQTTFGANANIVMCIDWLANGSTKFCVPVQVNSNTQATITTFAFVGVGASTWSALYGTSGAYHAYRGSNVTQVNRSAQTITVADGTQFHSSSTLEQEIAYNTSLTGAEYNLNQAMGLPSTSLFSQWGGGVAVTDLSTGNSPGYGFGFKVQGKFGAALSVGGLGSGTGPTDFIRAYSDPNGGYVFDDQSGATGVLNLMRYFNSVGAQRYWTYDHTNDFLTIHGFGISGDGRISTVTSPQPGNLAYLYYNNATWNGLILAPNAAPNSGVFPLWVGMGGGVPAFYVKGLGSSQVELAVNNGQTLNFYSGNQSGLTASINAATGAVAAGTVNGVYDYCQFTGMHCDGATDDTTAFNNLLQAVYNAGGGTITGTPGKKSLILGQVTLPNDGASFPNQKALKIVGAGSSSNGYWGAISQSGFTLDMRYNASAAKLLTLGSGLLEITGVNFVDNGSDCAPFILTTNTTVKIHENAFQGTASGASACNDAIILGGTNPLVHNTTAAAFQGYVSEVRGNFFGNIRQAVLGQNWSNVSVIANNTISATSGYPTGGAITYARTYVSGQDNSMYANVIENNSIEVSNYKYGVNMGDGSEANTIIANSCSDAGTYYTFCINVVSLNGYGPYGQNLIMGFGSAAGKEVSDTGPGAIYDTIINGYNGSMTASAFYTPSGSSGGLYIGGAKAVQGDGNNTYLFPSTAGSSVYVENFGGTKTWKFQDDGTLVETGGVSAGGQVAGPNINATNQAQGVRLNNLPVMVGDGTNTYIQPQASGGGVFLQSFSGTPYLKYDNSGNLISHVSSNYTWIPSTATGWTGNGAGGPALALTCATSSITPSSTAGGTASGTCTLSASATGHPGVAAATDGTVQGNVIPQVSVNGTTATVTLTSILAGSPTAKSYNVTVF